jgi:hypothetical protein
VFVGVDIFHMQQNICQKSSKKIFLLIFKFQMQKRYKPTKHTQASKIGEQNRGIPDFHVWKK